MFIYCIKKFKKKSNLKAKTNDILPRKHFVKSILNVKDMNYDSLTLLRLMSSVFWYQLDSKQLYKEDIWHHTDIWWANSEMADVWGEVWFLTSWHDWKPIFKRMPLIIYDDEIVFAHVLFSFWRDLIVIRLVFFSAILCIFGVSIVWHFFFP